MPHRRRFEPSIEGLIVRVENPPVPVVDWSIEAPGLEGLGALIRLRDDGRAVEVDGHTLRLDWKAVAALDTDDLRYVGLPDPAPVGLEIAAHAAIHDRNFTIQCGFVHRARRVVAARRTGAWLHFGGTDYLLLDPLYSIVDLIERFPKPGATDLETKMFHWSRIEPLLPEEALVSNHLKLLRIVQASNFTLNPFPGGGGEPDFDPVLGRRETTREAGAPDRHRFAEVLPPAASRTFATRFRRLPRVLRRYSLGGGAFVVLTPGVTRALATVKRAQQGSPEERRKFLADTSGYLRDALDDPDTREDVPLDDPDTNEEVPLDEVFSDDGLSDRVRAVGIWLPKALPWVQKPGNEWLPPDAAELAGADAGSGSSGEGAVSERAFEPRVLIIRDNLEDLDYRVARRDRTGSELAGARPVLQSRLYAHQVAGLEWLERHWDLGSWGALLADDMGLGKTLVALAFLAAVAEVPRTRGRPALVVAPTGLLNNWLEEHERHLPAPGVGRALSLHGRNLRALRKTPVGASARGGETGLALPLLDVAAIGRADWVLTTYETLRDYQHSLGRIPWSVGVFDEAQKFKNPAARLTDAVLAMNLDFALMMTGTPVENRPADIWSLLDRAEPGMFGTLKEFSHGYEAEADNGDQLRTLHHALTKTRDGQGPALMLRRLKEDHLDGLPEKRVHRFVIDMSPDQADAYRKVVMTPKGRGHIFETLHHLRRISLHHAHPRSVPDPSDYIRASARLRETFRILDDIARRGEKALVFVESKSMQAFLLPALRRRFRLPADVLLINGSVAGPKRQERVRLFQRRRGFDVMVLSPRAGGVGLTLTAANHVIHLSRWWNPAVEDQCSDRVYRIGQERTVHIYLPIARHPRFGDFSFDVKLDALLERKRRMNRQVLAPATPGKSDYAELYRSAVEEARARADS